MAPRTNLLAVGALASGAVWTARNFVAPNTLTVAPAQTVAQLQQAVDESNFAAAQETVEASTSSSGFGALATAGVALGLLGTRRAARGRRAAAQKKATSDLSSQSVSVPIGKGGFVGSTGEPVTVISRCPQSGRAEAQQVSATVAMAAGSDTKCAINGFGRIGRNVLRCWLGRETKPFEIVAINVGSMGPKTAAHLLKYDSVLGTLKADVSYTDETITVDGHVFKIVQGRDPTKMAWGDHGVEVVIESTGAFNSIEGGSKHLEAGAKKVVLTAPGKDCPTYVMGVNEGDYDPEKDSVISNASCTTNGMAPVCKVLDENFGVEYGMMTTTHSYTGDQMILDGRHKDLRRARAGAMNIIPTSTGAAKAVSKVLPKFEGKLNGISLRVPTPNVSVIDLVLKVNKSTSKEEVNAALKAAANGPLNGIIHFEEQPLVSSDFMQNDASNSVDADLTMVMGGDLVKVVLWYDNEWGYSQRVIDMTSLVASQMPVSA